MLLLGVRGHASTHGLGPGLGAQGPGLAGRVPLHFRVAVEGSKASTGMTGEGSVEGLGGDYDNDYAYLLPASSVGTIAGWDVNNHHHNNNQSKTTKIHGSTTIPPPSIPLTAMSLVQALLQTGEGLIRREKDVASRPHTTGSKSKSKTGLGAKSGVGVRTELGVKSGPGQGSGKSSGRESKSSGGSGLGSGSGLESEIPSGSESLSEMGYGGRLSTDTGLGSGTGQGSGPGAGQGSAGSVFGAELLLRVVLREMQSQVDREHDIVLTCQHALADTLVCVGEYSKARSLHESILLVRHRRHGLHHPATVLSCLALADTLRISLARR